MRVVLQRVARARVTVEDETTGQSRVAGAIEKGFLLFVGVADGDTPGDLDVIAEKIVRLRVFPDDEGKMNYSLSDVGGSLLVVSQFTLYADCRKGRRPSFIKAAPPETASRTIDAFVDNLRDRGARIESGVFGARMSVELVNEGPVTIILDSDELRRPRNG